MTYISRFRDFVRLVFSRRWLSNRTLLVKAILFQAFSSVATFLLVFAISGDLVTSANVSLLDMAGRTFLYYIFDVSWFNFQRKSTE